MQNVNTATTACRARAFSRRLRILILAAYLLIVSTLILPNSNAKFASSASGTSTAQIASFDYDLTWGSNANITLNGENAANSLETSGALIAVPATFTITNNGDVTFDYTLNFTLTDDDGEVLDGYLLKVPHVTSTYKAYMASDQKVMELAADRFYYKTESTDNWISSESTSVTGRLNCGESHTCTILYFINMTIGENGLPFNPKLGQTVMLNYDITCSQVD